MPKTRKSPLQLQGRGGSRSRRKGRAPSPPNQIALVLLAKYCKAYQLFVAKLNEATQYGEIVNAHRTMLFSYLKEHNIIIKGLNG